jgi:hypothetical protein
MSNDIAEPVTAPVWSTSPLSSVKCGCGFEITGYDEERNQDVFDSHECHYEYTPTGRAWHDNLFGRWGFITAMVLIVVAGILVEEWMAR